MTNTTNTTAMPVLAEALVINRDIKNARINGEAIGYANARKWTAAVKAVRIPAYAVRQYRYDHMGDVETVAPCDMTPLYNAITVLIDMIGEVNGFKLNSRNLVEEIIANVLKFKVIDITDEMAHARALLKEARKANKDNDTLETTMELEKCKAEVKRLEDMGGHCKRVFEAQTETAFVRAIEVIFGDAISKQSLKSAEQLAKEEEERRQARRQKTKEKKLAKKQAENKEKAEQ